MWSFETDPEFERELEWIDRFVRQEVEPLDHILDNPFDVKNRAIASSCCRFSGR